MSLKLRESTEDGETNNTTPERNAIPADSYIILLFGGTGVGKTSFANVASGSSMHVGKGMKSSTKQIESSHAFNIDDKRVVVVDCPGFDDTYLPEAEVLRRLSAFLGSAYENNREIIGLIYMHNITDTRVGGVSLRHMNMFKALCGPESLKNAVYVTNMWSQPPTEDELIRETELQQTMEFFGSPICQGAQIARHVNTRESAHRIIQLVLDKSPTVTRLQQQLVDEQAALMDTDIGRALGEDLDDAIYQQRQEVEELGTQKQRAFDANNQEWVRRLEVQEKAAEERERRLVDQIQRLKESGRFVVPASTHEKRSLSDPLGSSVRYKGERRAAAAPRMGDTHKTGIQNTNRGNPCQDMGESEWDRQRRYIEEQPRESERQIACMDRSGNPDAERQPSLAQDESNVADVFHAGFGLMKAGCGLVWSGAKQWVPTSFKRR